MKVSDSQSLLKMEEAEEVGGALEDVACDEGGYSASPGGEPAPDRFADSQQLDHLTPNPTRPPSGGL